MADLGVTAHWRRGTRKLKVYGSGGTGAVRVTHYVRLGTAISAAIRVA